MRKKLFSKIMAAGIAITFISFSILACLLVMITAQHTKDERVKVMKSFGTSLSELSNMIIYPFASADTQAIFELNLKVIAESLDAEIIVTDAQGVVVMKSQNSTLSGKNVVDGSIISTLVERGEYTNVGKLGGVYGERKYNVGVPIYSRNGSAVIGAIFVSSPPSANIGFLGDVGRLFTFSFFAVIGLSIMLSFIATRHSLSPIKELTKASKSFAGGDFSQRVEYHRDSDMGELVESFNNMAASLENLENTRRTFIANVSHDLRTPITTIGGFVDGILDGTIPEEEQRRYLEIVSSESRRLSRLVKTLLDISKIESKAYELSISELDLTEIVRRTTLSFWDRVEEKKLQLDLSIPESELEIEGDSDALTRVFYNLLDNAVKFTENGGYILVALRDIGNDAEFKIRNSGGGVSREDLNIIFERFYKSDASRGIDKSGLGLGLYIVKMIAEMHGGYVGVTSDGGSYCEFTVRLPKKQKYIKKP